jgi:hypothetical protein
MFETIFTDQAALRRHRGAPFAGERERYLKHCADLGGGRATLVVKATSRYGSRDISIRVQLKVSIWSACKRSRNCGGPPTGVPRQSDDQSMYVDLGLSSSAGGASRLNRRIAHAVGTWCSPVGARQAIRMAQDVRAVDLVVEQVEPEVWLRLRRDIELPLKRPDLIGCCQAHHQSPILGSFESLPEVRVLPSAGVTQPRQYYDPVQRPQGPSSRRCRRRDLRPERASPNYPAHPSDMPCPLPRSTGTSASVGCFPAPREHSPLFRRVGVHDFTFEACSGFTHVTANRIAQPPMAAFVTRL